MDEESRGTRQNVRNVLPMIGDVDQIKIVSRPGEAWPVRPLFALYGLRDLGAGPPTS